MQINIYYDWHVIDHINSHVTDQLPLEEAIQFEDYDGTGMTMGV